jgi:hypothetical protein
MRLAWCDALVLPVWVLVTFFAIAISLGAPPTSPGAGHTWFLLSLIIVLPLWLFLRAIDLATGGPARRRGSVVVRPIR